MPIEEYQSKERPGASYTIDYGAGWYIIKQGDKILKQVSSPTAMGLSDQDATLNLTRETAVADIDYNRGVDG